MELNSEQDFSFGSSTINYQRYLENGSPCGLFLCIMWAKLDAVCPRVELIWMVQTTPTPTLCDTNGRRCESVLALVNIMIVSFLVLVSFSFQPPSIFHLSFLLLLFKFILKFHHYTVHSPSYMNNIKQYYYKVIRIQEIIILSIISPILDSRVFVGKITDVSQAQMLSSREPVVSTASSWPL